MNFDLATLKSAVQTNCHIADATAAGEYTLCVYLMKMRELYRWESGYNYGDRLPKDEVGSWLREREALWESLQEKNFQPLPLENQLFDPFDAQSINQSLLPQKLVYSSGLGRNANAHFFLGVLANHTQHDEFEIFVVADEYARDLISPPAMSQGKTIYVRREAIRRMLWEKYEQWLWNKPENALGRALAFYDFDNDIETALDRMTINEVQSALLHEIGEIKAHQQLGDAWEELLIQVPHSKLELMLRSIRDHFADSLSTLPRLLADKNVASLHFYIANLTNMRKDLFPSIMQAYQSWVDNNDLSELLRITEQAQEHWRQLCLQVIQIANEQPNSFNQPIIDLIEQNRL